MVGNALFYQALAHTHKVVNMSDQYASYGMNVWQLSISHLSANQSASVQRGQKEYIYGTHGKSTHKGSVCESVRRIV